MGFNRPINENTDRVVSISNNAYSYFNFVGTTGEASLKYAQQLSASVYSDAIVTFWFEWGRSGDAYSSLPYASDHSSCAAGDSKSLVIPVCGAAQVARLVIHNTSGGTAAVIRDLSVYG